MAHTYKVGDTVVPTIGPHKGHPHTVIHVHSTGEVNIKPKGLHRSQNRYRMGAATAQPQHLNPHTVAESASCPDCGCDPCKCKKMNEDHVRVGDRVHAGFGAKGGAGFRGVVKKMDGNGHVHVELDKSPHDKFGPRTIIAPHHHVTKESLDEEMTPSHKGSHQYTGKIGGKTYVVPHATYSSFEPDYKKPLPHKTVTSREHAAKHNKNMSPEEIDKIHQHIQQVHKESVEEGYTTMKGKESFMKKKPLDVKYGSRWQVMSHGKTMERPTKEEVEQIDELKKSTMRSYMGKAAQDISGRQMSMFSPNEEPDNLRKINKRYSGIIRAGERMKKEEVELDEASLKDACWKGYEAIGMKEKGGKKVPNCVPVKEESRTATDTEHKASMKKLFSMPETKKTLKSLKRRDQDPDYDAKKQAQYRKKLMGEQTPSGGFAGPESAGVPMGGDISTKTVTGSDTAPKGTRKQEILKGAMKSAKEKQKQKLGGKSEFEKDPEYSPLVVTQP